MKGRVVCLEEKIKKKPSSLLPIHKHFGLRIIVGGSSTQKQQSAQVMSLNEKQQLGEASARVNRNVKNMEGVRHRTGDSIFQQSKINVEGKVNGRKVNKEFKSTQEFERYTRKNGC